MNKSITRHQARLVAYWRQTWNGTRASYESFPGLSQAIPTAGCKMQQTPQPVTVLQQEHGTVITEIELLPECDN